MLKSVFMHQKIECFLDENFISDHEVSCKIFALCFENEILLIDEKYCFMKWENQQTLKVLDAIANCWL